MKLSDTATGALCILGGAALAWHAQGFPRTAVQAYGPGFFPAILGIALALCGAVLVARGWGSGQAPVTWPAWVRAPAAWLRILLVPATIVAYLALAPVIGFLGAATLPTLVLLLVLTGRPAISALVALGSAIGIWVVFAKLLLVPLPAGPLELLLP